MKPNYVTPYLPREAKMEVKAWMNLGKPAFQRVVATNGMKKSCPNCAGVGTIFVSLCDNGPFQKPPAKVATWFDGDGMNGKGWYTINRTLEYVCPECRGLGQ